MSYSAKSGSLMKAEENIQAVPERAMEHKQTLRQVRGVKNTVVITRKSKLAGHGVRVADNRLSPSDICWKENKHSADLAHVGGEKAD